MQVKRCEQNTDVEIVNSIFKINEFQKFTEEFPLFSIHFIDKSKELENKDSFERAIKKINDTFGFPVFGFNKTSAYNIFVFFTKSDTKALAGVKECGTSEFTFRPNTHCWELIIFNEYNLITFDQLIEHELLHCLYIRHSDFQDSIMFPYIQKDGVIMEADKKQGQEFLNQFYLK